MQQQAFIPVIVSFVASALAGTVFATVPLAEDGRPMAIIVANGHDEPALQLQRGIEAAAAVRLPVVPDDSFREGRHDLVGRHDLGLILDDGPGGRPALILRMEESMTSSPAAYRLHTEPGTVYLTATSEAGLAAAVKALLMHIPDGARSAPGGSLQIPEIDEHGKSMASDETTDVGYQKRASRTRRTGRCSVSMMRSNGLQRYAGIIRGRTAGS